MPAVRRFHLIVLAIKIECGGTKEFVKPDTASTSFLPVCKTQYVPTLKAAVVAGMREAVRTAVAESLVGRHVSTP